MFHEKSESNGAENRCPTPEPITDIHELWADLFGFCDPGHLVGFGSLRHHPKWRTLAPLPLMPIPIGQLAEYHQTLDFHWRRSGQVQYQCYQPLAPWAARCGTIDDYAERLRRNLEPLYFRKGHDSVSALNVLLLDLDVGRPGLPEAEAARDFVVRQARANRIPFPSLTAFSGRGYYLAYMLCSETNPDTPAPKTPANRDRFRRAARAFVDRLEPMWPDRRKAPDFSSWFKRAGVKCHNTGRRVEFSRWFPKGQPRRYTLSQLLTFLDLPVDLPPVPSQKARQDLGDKRLPYEPTRPPKRTEPVPLSNVPPIEGYAIPRGAEPAAARIRDLERLAVRIRRNYRTYYLMSVHNAWDRFLRRAAPSEAKRVAAEKTREANQRLRNDVYGPLLHEEVDRIVGRPGLKTLNSRATVVLWLDISPADVEEYGLTHLVPDETLRAREQARQDAQRQRQDRAAAVDAALLVTGKSKLRPSEIARRYEVSREYVYQRTMRLRRLGRL